MDDAAHALLQRRGLQSLDFRRGDTIDAASTGQCLEVHGVFVTQLVEPLLSGQTGRALSDLGDAAIRREADMYDKSRWSS